MSCWYLSSQNWQLERHVRKEPAISWISDIGMLISLLLLNEMTSAVNWYLIVLLILSLGPSASTWLTSDQRLTKTTVLSSFRFFSNFQFLIFLVIHITSVCWIFYIYIIKVPNCLTCFYIFVSCDGISFHMTGNMVTCFCKHHGTSPLYILTWF